jgi:hypothetical protein
MQCADGNPECITSLPGLRWEDFTAAIKKSPIIMVTLLSDVYGKPTLSVRCTVTLNANDVAAIEKSEWSAPDCVEGKKRSFWENIFG